MILSITAAAIVGVCCLGACFKALENNNRDDNPVTNFPRNGNKYLTEKWMKRKCEFFIDSVSENPTVQLTQVVTSDTSNNQTTYPSTINDNNSHSRLVPSMPRRQDSLPSYDDAMKMPSAPPRE